MQHKRGLKNERAEMEKTLWGLEGIILLWWPHWYPGHCSTAEQSPCVKPSVGCPAYFATALFGTLPFAMMFYYTASKISKSIIDGKLPKTGLGVFWFTPFTIIPLGTATCCPERDETGKSQLSCP
jgi:hypothetical protein